MDVIMILVILFLIAVFTVSTLVVTRKTLYLFKYKECEKLVLKLTIE